MQFGVVFPQTQLGADPHILRDFVQAAEGMGYHHLLAYDHVLGANPDRPGWDARRPYTCSDMFHEPLTLFSWMAAFTRRIGFMTGVLILPQRQTALVAKQAAQVDLLSGGRLRLGIGIGWNEVEYTCLGEEFSTRGARVEEQIHILRQLWTRDLVNISGRFDTIDDAGINPLPLQQPIPIWIGGAADVALRRAARLSDGYIAGSGDPAKSQASIERYWQHAEDCGRRETIGLHARLVTESADEGQWEEFVRGWGELGATEIAIYPHGERLEDYLARLDRFRLMFGI
ncbi:MAG: LLM class F420-dependent oxidoreductase [Chloroflexi bacterium]|nr:LLM class F420-dependent oxidoreductase [Chloroflexota bacterium]MCY4248749.1 LLM class F420-dependent oxidoreductase [Chloroflexota bacterium]